MQHSISGVGARPGSASARPVAEARHAAFSSAHKLRWDRALAYYRKTLAQYQLFDREMKTIKAHLVQLGAARDVHQSGLSQALADVLERTAPVYQSRWWDRHAHANRTWIAEMAPLVEQFGDTLIQHIVAAFRTRQPHVPLRVDITTYAGWARIPHTTLPSRTTLRFRAAIRPIKVGSG